MEREMLDGLVAKWVEPNEPGVAVAVIQGGAVVYQQCRGLAVDQICDRRELRDRLADLFALMMKQPRPVTPVEAA